MITQTLTLQSLKFIIWTGWNFFTEVKIGVGFFGYYFFFGGGAHITPVLIINFVLIDFNKWFKFSWIKWTNSGSCSEILVIPEVFTFVWLLTNFPTLFIWWIITHKCEITVYWEQYNCFRYNITVSGMIPCFLNNII